MRREYGEYVCTGAEGETEYLQYLPRLMNVTQV